MVKQVPTQFIHHVWPSIKPMLEKALAHSAGEYNTEQLKVMLVCGSQTLLISENDGEITGAATVSFENYPNDRIAFITSIGGKMIANKEVWDQFEVWCKNNGCTKVRGFAFESVARLWKKVFGVETVYLVVEKKLGEVNVCS